jgi:SET domain-containing protein
VEESDIREQKYLKNGCIWCFILNRKTVRDAAVGGNVARFINHRCKPNCYTQIIGDIIWIRAGRNIRKGEELTYNYETEGGAGIKCLCRPGCKTVL